MKGLILAAGLGTRLRPLTRPPEEGGRSKPLVPLANQPLIAYPLQKLLEAGVTRIGIVTGANDGELRAALKSMPAELSFIHQPEPRGLAHAVNCARQFCADEEFVLLFCDNLFQQPLNPALAEWDALCREPARCAAPAIPQALIHTYEMADPRACGVAVVEDGWVRELEEKPAEPKSNLAIIGIDILTPLIFDAIARIKPSKRGELEITDAIAELLNLGGAVRARPLSGFWFDTGTFADLRRAQRPLLEEFGDFALRGRRTRCELRGPVGIARDSAVEDCRIDGPVLIAGASVVRGGSLGPGVSIGAHCRLDGCQLVDCQVYNGTTLSGVAAEGVIFDGEFRVSC